MRILAVDCCPRGASATKRLLTRYLDTCRGENAIERIRLYDEPLSPLREEDVVRRAELVDSGALDDPLFRYALSFRDADRIVIAAPYWDLSFPSLLKVYLESVSISGVTFGYSEDGESVGYCRANELVYLSTCGGYLRGRHLGAEYVRALADMFGIPETREYHIEGLDIDPGKRETLVEAGITRVTLAIEADERKADF